MLDSVSLSSPYLPYIVTNTRDRLIITTSDKQYYPVTLYDIWDGSNDRGVTIKYAFSSLATCLSETLDSNHIVGVVEGKNPDDNQDCRQVESKPKPSTTAYFR